MQLVPQALRLPRHDDVDIDLPGTTYIDANLLQRLSHEQDHSLSVFDENLFSKGGSRSGFSEPDQAFQLSGGDSDWRVPGLCRPHLNIEVFKTFHGLVSQDGANRLGITDVLSFTGQIPHDELPKYLASSDIYVDPFYPYKTGGGGIGQGSREAMSCGLPTVHAGPNLATTSAIKDGYNGYFFKDDNELSNILEKLINDEKLREKIGQNAGKSVLEHTWENTVDRLFKVFEKYQNID